MNISVLEDALGNGAILNRLGEPIVCSPLMH
jgi:hypothetical protein